MRTRGLVLGVAIVLSSLQLAADCVDGVTPDCSDAAANCGPSTDAAIETSTVIPEAGEADTGAALDAATDG